MASIHSQSDQTSGSGIYLKFPRITGFTVLEHLHEGSHSSIYRARQDRLGRIVALKVLPEWPPPTDVALERFNRAAYVSAQAPHPNLLTLYDTGTRDGFHFASLEFVVGQTLQRQLAQVAQGDERFAVHVGLLVARALTALQAKDICHRNIKPKNIFIETSGNVRVIGLGLASCKSAFFSPHLDAHPIGTPHFMAPEMIRGYCADPRSDLYSLGVTLYLMTAGRPPFDVGIPAAIMTRHLNETPHPLAELRPDLSKEFVHVVETLIAREPEERYQSARDVVDALEILNKKYAPVKAAPVPVPAGAAAAAAAPGASQPQVYLPSPAGPGPLSRLLSHPAAIALISVVATVLLLFTLSQAVMWLWGPRTPASAPAKPSHADTETAEAVEFRRLMEMDDAFRANPGSGADAWADFLTKFPEATNARQEYARGKLDAYLKLMNELLLQQKRRLRPAPKPEVERPREPEPAPAPHPDPGVDF